MKKYSRFSLQNREIPPDFYVDTGCISDVGCSRAGNEDKVGLFTFKNENNLLAVVADGMGGHQSGEYASSLAVETVQNYFSNHLNGRAAANIVLKNALIKANSAVHNQSKTASHFKGMGTTAVALAVINGKAFHANVGDSRLYLIRDGACRQLSQDHTLVAEMVERGLIDAQQAVDHPDKNVITRAIGTHPAVNVYAPDSAWIIKDNDCFLLCSDGLYDLVKESEMIEIVDKNPPSLACSLLVDLTNSRGGYDNTSIIIIKIFKNCPAGMTKTPPNTRA